jgi:hypothetical protein
MTRNVHSPVFGGGGRLDVATPLLESRDMQYAVGLLLTQGARTFIHNHAEVLFEGR